METPYWRFEHLKKFLEMIEKKVKTVKGLLKQ